jgi:copper ion binding protein
MEKTILIEGMSCNHCKMHVEKALKQVAGVSDAVVDLSAKNATVKLNADVADATLTKAVEEAGYDVTSIR